MKATQGWAAGLAAALLLLAGCSTVVPTPQAASPTPAQAHAAWARVLALHVNAAGEVDFAALARGRGDLDTMLRHVAETPLPAGAEASDAQLAHLINAYNAVSMANVIDSGLPETHAGLNLLRFFVLRRYDIGGQAMSLYALENDVIRPIGRQRGDPRLHFALNCSARACPVLPREPFDGAMLDAQLQRETLAFFARPMNLRIDPAERTLWLSAILDFYTEDFVPLPAPGLAAYAARYAPQPVPADYRVRFTPYDWRVAHARAAR
jgi:hypothetical protein